MTFHSRSVRFALTLSLVCCTATSALAQHSPQRPGQPSSSPRSSTSVLPAPPPTPPLNRTRSGGSLGVFDACNHSTAPLLALVPVENPVLTTAEFPTLLFYVPYGSADIRRGEFSVLVGLDEMAQLHRLQFTLPATPGIVSISLPRSPDYALQEGVFYHWYFKLYCNDNTTSRADFEVNGWIQRAAITPEREQQINTATPDIWYDSLARLSDRLRTSPQNSELQDRWYNLLNFIHLEELTQEPLLGAVTLVEE
jgi:Domain of Unknown Function (DUF928)